MIKTLDELIQVAVDDILEKERASLRADEIDEEIKKLEKERGELFGNRFTRSRAYSILDDMIMAKLALVRGEE